MEYVILDWDFRCSRAIATNTTGVLVTEHNYSAVNANDSRTTGFYIVKFLTAAYTLQHNEIVNNEVLTSGTLVSDAVYMRTAMKDSLWYAKAELDPVKVNMEK
eukprot:13272264-Ditylum_brightwellii.AAC.1